MIHYDPRQCLPSSAELPDSDDTPVDNELQNLIPNLLEAILAQAWADRTDWFFGVDMGIYHNPEKPPIVPDGFLSLGVERFIGEEGRLSYVLWEEVAAMEQRKAEQERQRAERLAAKLWELGVNPDDL